MRRMRKSVKKALLSLLLSTLLLTGCGQADEVNDVIAKDSSVSASGSETSSQTNAVLNSGASEIPVCTLDITGMFSDRDKEVGFDENSDTVIQLNGTTASCTSKAVEISGSTVTINDEGTYILLGSLSNGQIIVDAEDTDKIQLVLNGMDITCASSAAIYVKQADKVFLTLAPNTTNSLQTTGEFVAIDDNNIDATIFSKDDLTLNGSGSLQVSCAYGHGIVSKDDLVITGGQYEITASNHGLSGKDSVRIAAGNISLDVGEDGIHSENKDDATLGFVYVEGGEITIVAGDDGIHAGNQVLIAGGTVNITESYEGIEGMTVDIAGGEVTVHSSDDGLNATDGSSSEGMGKMSQGSFDTKGDMAQDPFAATEGVYIKISGGSLKVTAYGDGIDSNGNLYVTGGETYVFGPENSGNGSLDYAGNGVITGGTLVAAGASGMAQNFGSNSTQCAMLVTLNSTQSAGTAFSLQDAEGKEIISATPETLYNCVLISCPELSPGNTYTLTAGTESVTVEQTETIYGNGMGGFGGKGGGHGGMGGFGENGTKPDNMDGFGGNGNRPDNMDGFGGSGSKPGTVDGMEGDGTGRGGKGSMGEFSGELPQGEMPQGELPQMPEGGFNGEMPQGQPPQMQQSTNQS